MLLLSAVAETQGGTSAAPVNGKPPEPPKFKLDVTRNGVTATLEETTETKGKGADKDFMGLITDLSVEDLVKFTNPEWVKRKVLLNVKKALKSLYDQALNADKQLDVDKFKRLVETATFTTETIKELNDKIEAKLTEVLTTSTSTEGTQTDRFTKIQALLVEIAELKCKKEEKQRVPDEEDDEAAEVPATPAATGDLNALKA